MTQPRLYAHRGAARELPENTMPAFRRALAVGATALETDVHLTRDGHVVLSHDPTGERAAQVHRAIGDTTLDEVRRWDVGRTHRVERPEIGAEAFTVPTLEELLRETPGVLINVDIKQHDAAAAAATVAVVRRVRAEDRVLLTSFDAGTIRRVRRLGYEGATGLGASELVRLLFTPQRLLAALPLRGSAAQMPTRMGPLPLDRAALLAKAHALGLLVHYWTINDPVEAARLLALGADGIMTDDPAAIAPVFARYVSSAATPAL
ncbi:Glycerophosphoryl diester phosphodiesterase [Minicystis rosea]|nr:Glycerophosphoryl diester phosphodiesterase [Minicystis rosea]